MQEIYKHNIAKMLKVKGRNLEISKRKMTHDLQVNASMIMEADEPQDPQGELAGWRLGRVRCIPSSEGWQA